jgi:hypothetical protein
LHQDHQAQGLRRLFSHSTAPATISILSACGSQARESFSADLARALSGNGRRVLRVESRLPSMEYRPLFRWDATRPLMQQVTAVDGHELLFAPGCTAGDRAIVQAAADLKEGIDLVLFGGSRYTHQEAALETAAGQTLVLLLADAHANAAYALVKGVSELPAAMDILLAGAGGDRIAQAAERFLKMTISSAAESDAVWHIRHAGTSTSSNTLSGCPELPRYVARILNWRGPEAKLTTSHASQ